MDWQGQTGLVWADNWRLFDRLLGPVGAAAMDTMGDVSGRRVLDIGCGAGSSTLALADRGALATGIDLSEAQLDVARTRDTAERCTFVCGDAAEVEYAQHFDAAYSRCGLMFFDRPVVALEHVRHSMHPGARLTAVFWRSVAANEWAGWPVAVLRGAVGDAVSPMLDGEPGPFAWADADLPRDLFSRAGWRDVSIGTLDRPVPMAEPGQGDPVEAAMALLGAAVAGRRLSALDEPARGRAADALHAALSGRVAAGEIHLGSSAWCLTATA